MDDKPLPVVADVVAPDGSQVRVLCATGRGSMAHFTLGPGEVARAVRHRTVEEIWYVVDGFGSMWRRDAEGRERVIDLRPGISLTIPMGTAFQFRNTGEVPLGIVGVTMPPWPGDDEAEKVDGPWEPHLDH